MLRFKNIFQNFEPESMQEALAATQAMAEVQTQLVDP